MLGDSYIIDILREIRQYDEVSYLHRCRSGERVTLSTRWLEKVSLLHEDSRGEEEKPSKCVESYCGNHVVRMITHSLEQESANEVHGSSQTSK